MLRDLGWLKQVKIQDSTGTVINPSTNEKLDELKTLLQKIDVNTDELEINTENIEINTDNINLNTDELESKIDQTNIRLGEVQTSPTQYTVLARLKDLWDKLVSLFNDGVAKIKIWNGTNVVNVDSYGRLSVNNEVSVPGGATEVETIEFGDVSGSHDNIYLIPSGETLIIRKLTGGAEIDAVAGSVIELFYDPNGTGVGMTLIETIYASGNSFWQNLAKQYIGDGTKAIRLRRRRLTGGAREIFARWEGYY